MKEHEIKWVNGIHLNVRSQIERGREFRRRIEWQFSLRLLLLLTIRMKMYSELNWRFVATFMHLHQHQMKSSSFNNTILSPFEWIVRLVEHFVRAACSSHFVESNLNDKWTIARTSCGDCYFDADYSHKSQMHNAPTYKSIFTDQFTSWDSIQKLTVIEMLVLAPPSLLPSSEPQTKA